MFVCYREPCWSREVHFPDLSSFVRSGPAVFSDRSWLIALNHSGIIFSKWHYIRQFHMRKPSSVSVFLIKESQVNPNIVSKKCLLFRNWFSEWEHIICRQQPKPLGLPVTTTWAFQSFIRLYTSLFCVSRLTCKRQMPWHTVFFHVVILWDLLQTKVCMLWNPVSV